MLCVQARSAETYYDVGARAFPMQQAGGTARAVGMGSAVVGVSQGSASLLWNPAGLSRLDSKEIGLHHNTGFGGVIQEIAIIGAPLGGLKEDGTGGRLGGLAASFGYVNYGSFRGRDEFGVKTEYYHASDYAGSLGWGMEIVPGVSGGVAMKAKQANFATKSYSGLTTDVGVLWKVRPSLDLGVTYSNLNLGGNVGGSLVSSGWRLGAGWQASRHWLVAASAELQAKAMDRLQLGTEYLVGNIDQKGNDLFLRAGYQFNFPDPQLSGLTGLTLGVGYAVTRNIILDYAALPTGELGTSHRVSLTIRFNHWRKKEPEQARAAAAPVVVAAAPYVAPAPPVVIVLRSIILEDSHFDFNQSALKPEAKKVLKENIAILTEVPKARVRVSGYTSMRGKAEYNQLLSERRAHAVKDYMVAEGGIAPDRITTIGYGENRPAEFEMSPKKVDMASAAAKANMRVEIDVIAQ
ncbi:MAG: hypothetical protein A2506_03470 [Elusimicrobia bacterium RIFOXYD12_FULL_66_9]|nr:MAG: hypothetical protein A2506_03470 [Elusimicrobia bacterium RIFOXYD12_FULL_66_9]